MTSPLSSVCGHLVSSLETCSLASEVSGPMTTVTPRRCSAAIVAMPTAGGPHHEGVAPARERRRGVQLPVVWRPVHEYEADGLEPSQQVVRTLRRLGVRSLEGGHARFCLAHGGVSARRARAHRGQL